MNKKIKIVILSFLFLLASSILFLHLFPRAAFQLAAKWERTLSGVEKKLAIVDGWHFYYIESKGSRAGKEILLLVHGFGGDKDNWTRFIRYLPDRYHAIAPDLPGFGENDRKPKEWYDVRSQVERLHKFVQQLGLRKFHIAGNSMGGHIAGIYAVTYPEEILSVAFIDNAGVSSLQKSEHEKLLEKGINKLVAKNTKEFDELLHFVFVKVPSIPDSILTVLAKRAIASNAFNQMVFEQYKHKKPYPLEPRLRDIQAPVWILWGEKDRIIHVSTVEVMKEKLTRAKKNFRVTILPNCGHSPMIELPEISAEKYVLFLEQLPK
ncbi:MAG: alpha/beta hydrolase [Candidatus Hydrogenedentota bacterium]|nr:MAG: alpha/beta hydrolase [Candidatus Hydrogenedentota bacterium]